MPPPPPTLAAAADRDPVLDALRGLAALLVVLFHYTAVVPRPSYPWHAGSTAVDLFFIISGYVIYLTLRRAPSARDFGLRRAIRLYPTYWVCVTFTFGVNAWHDLAAHSFSRNYALCYLGNLTMLQHYLHLPNLDPPYWTLLVELVFYLTMLGIYRAGLLGRIEWVGGLLLLGTALVAQLGPPYAGRLYRAATYWFPLLNHFSLFFAGILFYRIRHDGATVARWLLLAACYATALLSFGNLGRALFLTYPLHAAMLSAYFGLWLLYLRGWLAWLAWPPLVYVGSVSYALYLVHQDISLYYLRPWLTGLLGEHFWLINSLMLLLVLALASLITYGAERPAMRYLKALLLPTRPTPAASAG